MCQLFILTITYPIVKFEFASDEIASRTNYTYIILTPKKVTTANMYLRIMAGTCKYMKTPNIALTTKLDVHNRYKLHPFVSMLLLLCAADTDPHSAMPARMGIKFNCNYGSTNTQISTIYININSRQLRRPHL